MQVRTAIEHLTENGIRVAVDPSGIHADVYVLTLANGDQYECLAAGLLKLAGAPPSVGLIEAVGKKI